MIPLVQAGKYTVREAVLHCAAVPTGWAFRHTNAEIRDIIYHWHTDPEPKGRGWRDIGYHYIVMPDGSEVPGRPLDQVGAHVLGYNPGRLGVLMVERFKVDRIGKFGDYFSLKQRDTVRTIVRRHGITEVSGHNDYDRGRRCPGFRVQARDFL